MIIPIQSRQLDYANPVNWDHPLNRGLLSLWEILPEWWGGFIVRDLAGKKNGIWNIGGDEISTKWVASSRRGGHGEWLFNGMDDFIDCGSFSGLRTVTAWAKTTVSGFNRIFGWRTTNAFSIFFNDNITLRYNTTSDSLLFSPLTLNRWYFVVGTIDPLGKNSFYVDGELIGTPVSRVIDDSAGDFVIGVRAAKDLQHLDGSANNIRLYNRHLSAAEVNQLFQEEQIQFNDLLNYKEYFLPIGAAPPVVPTLLPAQQIMSIT